MNKPHVLVVLVDQHRFDCVGINGNPDIKTPHLDALAKDGVSYTNCFSTFPLCTPARYSLLTGLYIRQHQGAGNRFTIPKELTTFAKELRNVGYRTDYIGKLHSQPTYSELGFDQLLLSEQEGPGRYEDDYHRNLMGKGLVDFTDMQDQVQDLRKGAPQSYRDNFGTEPSTLSADDYSTGWIGRNALDHIAKWKDATEPQLLMVGFIKPHHPFDEPSPWKEMYDPEPLQLLPGWSDAVLPRDNDYYKGFFDNHSLSEPVAKKILAQYYASISHIDAFVGHMVALLKKLALYDNTLIIYVSDHGEYMGYHHLMLKNNYIYDPVIKVPLIVKYPKGSSVAPPQQSPTDDKLVSLIDATATIYAVAGVPIPASLQPIIQPLHSSSRDVVYAENTNSTMIRSKNYKLLFSEYKPSVFFDLRKDPYEIENVIDKPEYAEVVKQMTEQVKAWIDADDFEINDFSPLESWAAKRGLRYEEKEEMDKVEQYLRGEYEKEMQKRI